MWLEERAISEAAGTILVHNLADAEGHRVFKKGTLLTESRLSLLAELGHRTVTVAVLEEDDVHEDVAASTLAKALQTEALRTTRAAGGRVNLHAEVDGLLEVDAERLLELNLLGVIALATRSHHTLVGPRQEATQVATLKIIPYAISRRDLDHALVLASPRPGIVEVRPFPKGQRVAMLLTGDQPAHDRLHADLVPPTRIRLERLGAELVVVEAVPQETDAIRQAVARLAPTADLLIIAGQTSIMDENDVTPRALREAGAEEILHGAPVEPGNLLALAYLPSALVLCAPGCARGLNFNVVDIVLPRLLLGDRLSRADIATLGPGGLLTKAD
jgi:molybdenum cofactor cytidylyltransferase